MIDEGVEGLWLGQRSEDVAILLHLLFLIRDGCDARELLTEKFSHCSDSICDKWIYLQALPS